MNREFEGGVCIAIPVYKSFNKLTSNEFGSLNQCMKVLSRYRLYLFGPVGMDYTAYRNLAKHHGVEIECVNFPRKYFRSTSTYNRLLLSPFFYRTFRKHEYLLIYQLDAWVFSDELEYWCSKGFDYIGAPWYESFGLPIEEPKILAVGNGGFSLRKIKSHIRVLYSFSYISSPSEIWTNIFCNNVGVRRKLVNIFRFLSNVTFRNNSFFLFNSHAGQEDGFWCFFAAKNFQWYKVADVESAIAFSFETHPEKLYILNNHKLPFGCHAWEKHNPEFWKSFVNV